MYEGERTRRNGTYVLWVEYDDGEVVGHQRPQFTALLEPPQEAERSLLGRGAVRAQGHPAGEEITIDYGEEWANVD